MTPINRPVRRVTREIDTRTGRPIVIELMEGGRLVRVRAKGQRTAYVVPYKAIWMLGAKLRAAEIQAAKKAKREERRRQREGR